MSKNKFWLRVIFCVLFSVFNQQIFAQSNAATNVKTDKTEAEKWREDLRYMAEQMPKTHNNLFHTMSREQFDAAVKKLDARIPTLARHQIIVEMARITAMVNDGHSNVYPTRDPKIGFRSFPLKMYFFKDGLYVRSATANTRASSVRASSKSAALRSNRLTARCAKSSGATMKWT
jgi:hypothetical protein